MNWIFFIPFGIWLFLFVFNVVLLCRQRISEFDEIFILGKYLYSDIERRLFLIEKLTGTKQIRIRKIQAHVIKNYNEKGILNIKRFSPFIESIIEKSLITLHKGEWNYFWSNASTLTKVHLFYILLAPYLLFLSIELEFAKDPLTGEFLESISDEFYIALPFLIFAILMITTIILVSNILLYYIVQAILISLNLENGAVNKNVFALESLTNSIKFYKRSTLILASSGLIASLSIGKLFGFKGLGGGKFGGGGASGSW